LRDKRGLAAFDKTKIAVENPLSIIERRYLTDPPRSSLTTLHEDVIIRKNL